MDTNLLLTKVQIANNKTFIKSIIEKAEIKAGDKVAVAFWCTPVVYETVKNMYPEADVYYIEDKSMKNMFNISKAKFVDIDNKEYWPNMKFDKVIMNPPYERNLHLKIVREVLKHISDDGEIINLSPIRWLQDPFHNVKKSTLNSFSDVAQHILNSPEIIINKEANKYFGISIYSDLGVYKLVKNKTKFDYNNYWKLNKRKEELSIIENVCMNNHLSINDMVEENKKDGIRALIAPMAGNRGNLPVYKDIDYVINGKRYNKDWTELKNNGGYEKAKNSPLPLSIKFDTEKEAKNFYESIKTKFYRYICNISVQQQHIQLDALPFMPSYKQRWTDERFYEYFKLTKAEIKLIEDTMKEYE